MSHDVPVFMVIEEELRACRGLSILAVGVYFVALKPLADPQTGDLLTMYREIAKRMTPVQIRRSDRRPKAPTLQQMRTAIQHLCDVGLVQSSPRENVERQMLALRLTHPGTYPRESGSPRRHRGRSPSRGEALTLAETSDGG